MSYTAYVSDDFIGRSVRIAFISDGGAWPGDRAHIYNPVTGIAQELEEGVEPPQEAIITLRSDMARALLQSLTNHYQGAEDTRALRKDYDHEKQRVDKMLDALIARASA